VHIDRIESVQKILLLFALRSLNWDQNVRLPSYQSRLLLLNLPTLVNRKTLLGTFFMQNLIINYIDSVELVNRLSFNVPVRLTRNYYPLNLPRCTSNFCLQEPFRVLCNNYNNLYHLICTSTSILVTKTNILRVFFIYCIFLANSQFLPKLIKKPRA